MSDVIEYTPEVIVYTKTATSNWDDHRIKGLKATVSRSDTQLTGVYQVVDAVPYVGGFDLSDLNLWQLTVEIPEVNQCYEYVAWIDYDRVKHIAFRDGHVANKAWVLDGERVNEWALLQRLGTCKLAALELIK